MATYDPGFSNVPTQDDLSRLLMSRTSPRSVPVPYGVTPGTPAVSGQTAQSAGAPAFNNSAASIYPTGQNRTSSIFNPDDPYGNTQTPPPDNPPSGGGNTTGGTTPITGPPIPPGTPGGQIIGPGGTVPTVPQNTWIDQVIAQVNAEGFNITDPTYWYNAIASKGGLTSENVKYWSDRMKGINPSAGGGPTNSGGPVDFTQFGNINQTPQSAQEKELFDLLMSRAKEPIPTGNDPIIKAQTDAFAASNTRAMRDYLTSLAERSGPNANLGAQTASANEKVGQEDSQFTAQVIGQQLQQRASDIQNALTSMQGLLTAQQTLSLQEELGRIQAAIQYANLQQQGYFFDSNMGARLAGF